jgi:hypothetical protein
MQYTKTRELDYISKAFSKLSTEKQENVLKSAMSLLAIQKNDTWHITACMLYKNESKGE